MYFSNGRFWYLPRAAKVIARGRRDLALATDVDLDRLEDALLNAQYYAAVPDDGFRFSAFVRVLQSSPHLFEPAR